MFISLYFESSFFSCPGMFKCIFDQNFVLKKIQTTIKIFLHHFHEILVRIIFEKSFAIKKIIV